MREISKYTLPHLKNNRLIDIAKTVMKIQVLIIRYTLQRTFHLV